MNKLDKIKISLTGVLIDFLDKTEALVSSYSIEQYFNYEIKKYYQLRRQELRDKRKRKMRMAATIAYLKKHKLIKIVIKNNQKFYKLTQLGQQKALFNSIVCYKRAKYYKSYKHLIVFDVPEKLRRLRELLRKNLYYLNYERIQKSCFINDDQRAYELIKKVIKDNGLDNFAKIFLIK